jgi:SynChlorMet cassette radical SAM/SPASM protein ScmE
VQRIMSTPRSMDLHITSECNLRCSYCSHFSSEGDVGEDVATDEWLAFFEELGRCAVLSVCLQGGEPLMRPDLSALVQGIVRNRMRFSLLSNGTLVTDELAAMLSATGRCDVVQLSIDGAGPDAHDAFRGSGNFEKAVSGMRILLKHGIPLTVRITIHRENVGELEEIVGFLLDDVRLPSISTNSADYLGLCRKNSGSVRLTREQQCHAMATLTRLTQKYGDRISATAGPLAEARIWTEMENAFRDGVPGLSGGGHLTGCSGAFTKLAVRADGTFIPCAQLPGIPLGRMNKDSLRDVWLHHAELRRFRERSEISLDRFPYCRDCRYINYCRGGCAAISATMLGDPYRPSPGSCYRRFVGEETSPLAGLELSAQG